MTGTKYGVISDVHQDPRIVPIALNVLKSQGIEKLIVNGDIGEKQETLEQSQGYIAFILDSIGKSQLEAFVQPGTHESFEAYHPVIEHFSKKYPNIINTLQNQKLEQPEYDLVFLPGSDISFCNGGGYQFVNDETETGVYEHDNRLISVHNMNDLKKLVTRPDKTIFVCHNPRKFDNPETCVDMAEFGEATCNFIFQGKVIKKGQFISLEKARYMIGRGYPVEVQIKKENKGNEDLKSLYEELGITKALSGHFHESGHRANDRNGNHVEENQLVEELFWNSGYLDAGQTGILSVIDGKVSYRNINLQDYLK